VTIPDRTWLVRLNGTPLMTITGPAHTEPVAAARQVLLHGTAPEGVTVKWAVIPA